MCSSTMKQWMFNEKNNNQMPLVPKIIQYRQAICNTKKARTKNKNQK